MATRTDEREEFLGDILTTAIEGGTGYWAQVSQYQYVMDNETRVCVGERKGDGAKATIHELEEGETGYKPAGVVIDVDTIARGLSLIVDERGEFKIFDELRRSIQQADKENDAGFIDADGADAIVQAALFGELRYG